MFLSTHTVSITQESNILCNNVRKRSCSKEDFRKNVEKNYDLSKFLFPHWHISNAQSLALLYQKNSDIQIKLKT